MNKGLFGLNFERELGRRVEKHPRYRAAAATKQVKARFVTLPVYERLGPVKKNFCRINTRIPLEIQHTRKKRKWVWAATALADGTGFEVKVPRYLAFKSRVVPGLKVKDTVKRKIEASLPAGFFDGVRQAAHRIRPDYPPNMIVITTSGLNQRTAWDMSRTQFERLQNRLEFRTAVGLNNF